MSGISFTGIGSGMPVQDLVSAFVEAERVPFQQRMNKKGADLTTDISANGTLKSILSDLASSLKKLKDADNYQLRSNTGSDKFVAIKADKTAQLASYDVKVENLAQAHKVMSTPIAADTAIGEGKMTFKTANNTTGFAIDVSDTDTLADIRDKINIATDNDDITATIITDGNGTQSLVMSSNKTGLKNKLEITATQADGTTALDPSSDLNKLLTQGVVASTLIETNPALDAKIIVDGTIVLTSDTNEFKDAIDGVTFTAKKTHGVDDDNSKLAITEDNKMVAKELEAFVNSYNEYYATAKKLGQAGSDSQGPMSGDSMLRGVTSKLRSMLSQSFSKDEQGGKFALSQLGIEADQYGKLSLDKDVLNDLVTDDPDAVQKFFVGTEDKPGFAMTFDSMVQSYVKKDGLIDTRIKGFEGQLKGLDEDMVAFSQKMEKYESRLLSQYNAMDMLVANMNATSGSLMAQLDNMPGVVRSSK